MNHTKPPHHRTAAAMCWLAALTACLSPTLRAHEIPADTTVRAFIKPDGARLRFLIRVPMAAIRDIEWPVRRVDGSLDIPIVEPALRDAVGLWITSYVDMFEGLTKLPEPDLIAVRLSLEDNAFASYQDALAAVTGPKIPDDTRLQPKQGMLDTLLEYPIQSDRSRFSFHPRFDHFGLRVATILRFQTPDGAVRAFEYEGDSLGRIRLDPTWYQAAWIFGTMGFRHILDGADHLLFLFCLVIPFRRFVTLVPVVTAFTVAHSVTLIASAYDMAPGPLWFPPLVATLIASSILYLAIENIVVADPRRRWMVAFGFGLAHGFGFAFAMRRSLQLAGAHHLTSLLSFNVGIEAGQVFMLAVIVPALWLVFRLVPVRAGVIVLSGLAAHTGWHWLLDRFDRLSQYRFEWPAIDAAFLANVMRWLMVMVALAFVFWLFTVLRPQKEYS